MGLMIVMPKVKGSIDRRYNSRRRPESDGIKLTPLEKKLLRESC